MPTRLAVCVSLALAMQAALADDPPEAARLDPIVVTGAKSDQQFGGKSGIPLSRMPQSVQVVTAQTIADYGMQSFGDVLRDVPSANPGNSRVARYQSFSLKVRGFLADQMRNGIRQRYYEDVDASALSNVERVEVLKGPSSVLYGQSALGGILSTITKRPQREFAASAAITLGSFGQTLLTGDLTGALDADGNLLARLTGEVERSGTYVDHQDMHRDNAALSLAWRASDRVQVQAVAEYVARRTLGNPGLPVVGTVLGNGRATVPASRYLGEPGLSDLEAHAPLLQLWADIRLADGWTLTPRYQYQQFNTEFHQIRLRGMGSDGVTLARNGRYGKEADRYFITQLDLQGRVTTGGIGHSLLLGVESSRDRTSFLQRNLSNVGRIDVLNPVYTYDRLAPAYVFAFASTDRLRGSAVYAQDVIALTPDWDVVAGLRSSRFDYLTTFNGSSDATATRSTSWQLGSNLRLDRHWSLYGGVNTGIDVENILGARAADGSAFKPERAEQQEVGARYAGGGLRLSAALFDIRRQDVLTADPEHEDFQIQTGEHRVRGLEIEGEWQASPALRLTGGAAWMKGEVSRSNDGDAGQELGDTPRHAASLRADWSVGQGWTLRGGLNHQASRRLVTGSAVRLPGYTLASLGLGYDAGRWAVDAWVNNLTDRRYYTASGNAFGVYAGDPRQIGVRLVFRP